MTAVPAPQTVPITAEPQHARSRTFTWEDPRESAAKATTMSGLEFLRSFIRGETPTPPMARALDFWLSEADDGRAVVDVKPQEFHLNPSANVHGGLSEAVMDSALGCAVLSTLPRGVGYTIVELHINIVRAMQSDTPKLRAIANVLHRGRTLRTAECKLVDEQGKLYAHATATCAVLVGGA